MNIFNERDLRKHTGELIRNAGAGELSIVMKHGRSVFIAVPFDEKVLKAGISVTLAIKLYEEEVLSMSKAAKFADCPVTEFTEHLGAANIPGIRYSTQELDEELAVLAESIPE